uniref:Prolipoprotein diacylglyceryltransferase n=1 Tax=Streptomyces auratus AGR0001 TaxID=1160718 RepID=J1RKZ5_9ACTN
MVRGSGPGAAPARNAGGGGHHVVDQAVLLGLIGGEPAVAVRVLGDPLDGLTGVEGRELRHPLLGVQQPLGVDLDVRRGTRQARGGLVDEDLGVRQREALARGAGAQQELSHGGGEAHRDRHHVVLDVLHGVVDRQAGRDRAARGVDVEEDVLVRVRGEEKQLRGDLVGDVVVDRLAEEDDPLAEQPVVDLVAEATEGRLSGGGRHRDRHVSTCSLSDGSGRLSVVFWGAGIGAVCGSGAVSGTPLPSYLRTLTRRSDNAIPHR